MDMNRRSAILKKVVADQGELWSDGPPKLATFEGDASVATKNTVYRFHDGICFSVDGRNKRPPSGHDIRVEALQKQDCFGMRIVAWLLDHDTDHPSLSSTWQPGACAVLWRRGLRESVALTSPTVQFNPSQDENYRPERIGPDLKRSAPPAYGRPSNASMTRINVPAPTKSGTRLTAISAIRARSAKG